MAVAAWHDPAVRLESDIRDSRRQNVDSANRTHKDLTDRSWFGIARGNGNSASAECAEVSSSEAVPTLKKISVENPVQGHAVKSELWARKLKYCTWQRITRLYYDFSSRCSLRNQKSIRRRKTPPTPRHCSQSLLCKYDS